MFQTTTCFLVAILLLGSTANAFSVGGRITPPVRPDTSKVVEDALKITASFGIDSKEARVAWDIVEEMDASDNTQATTATLDQECSIEEDEPSPECLDYGQFLVELYTIRDSIAAKGPNKKAGLVDTLKLIKLEKPKATTATSSPELTKALEAAKAATAKNGISSVESRLAWETYEEIAAAGTDKAAIGINLMEECGIESGEDACRAMEELQRIMPVLLALSK